MLIETFLRWFVVIWADAKHAADASEITILEFIDHRGSIIASAPHQNGYSALHIIDNGILNL